MRAEYQKLRRRLNFSRCLRALCVTATFWVFGYQVCFAQVYGWSIQLPTGISKQDAAIALKLTERFATATTYPLTINRVDGAAPPADLIRRVQHGDIQLAVVPLDELSESKADFGVFNSLFLFRDLDAVERYQRSRDGAHLLKELERGGLVGLATQCCSGEIICAQNRFRAPPISRQK